jgi:hypothetical protein
LKYRVIIAQLKVVMTISSTQYFSNSLREQAMFACLLDIIIEDKVPQLIGTTIV